MPVHAPRKYCFLKLPCFRLYFSFELFQDEFEIALKNARYYAEDLQDIKRSPDTNLPELIKELLQQNNAYVLEN